MKSLRKYIRQILLNEIWEMSDEDIEGLRATHFDRRRKFSNDWIRKNYNNRAIGYQGVDAIKSDREQMKLFNDKLNNTPEGRKVRDQFINGDLQILHSISYQGSYSKKHVTETTPFTSWLQKFSNNKDQLSCVAANAPIGRDPKISRWFESYNGRQVYQGYGFLMKGYPAFISKTDEWTQTLTALPQSLIKHQEQSGIAKRVDNNDNAIDFKKWYGAAEVILDNWQPIGIYIHESQSDYLDLLNDAKGTGLPVYQVNKRTDLLERIV